MNVVHVKHSPLVASYPVHFLQSKCGNFYLSGSPKIGQFTGSWLSMGVDWLFEDCRSRLKTSEPQQLFKVKNSSPRNEEHQPLAVNSNVNDDPKIISNSLINNEIKKYVELERRRKIGMANKGNTPWNKGKKHRPETCELIRRRTAEAMGSPKVRRKLFENPRYHSAETKAKIGLSQKRRLAEVLKHKKVQEKCYLTWSHSIAEAAKNGSQEQQELEWDSYQKLKAYIVLDHVQRQVLKARAKDFAKLEAVEAEKAKAARRNRRAEKEKEEEEKSESRVGKRSKKKPVNDKLSTFDSLRQKIKTTKMPPPILTQETGDNREMDMQKWDLEFIKEQKLRQRVSFADQIQAAKSGQAISPMKGVPPIRPSEFGLPDK